MHTQKHAKCTPLYRCLCLFSNHCCGCCLHHGQCYAKTRYRIKNGIIPYQWPTQQRQKTSRKILPWLWKPPQAPIAIPPTAIPAKLTNSTAVSYQ